MLPDQPFVFPPGPVPATFFSSVPIRERSRVPRKDNSEPFLVNVAIGLMTGFLIVVLMVILRRPELPHFLYAGHDPVSFRFEDTDKFFGNRPLLLVRIKES